jgi:GTP:adenosylcobinamide-phosphate guanylyltransferase
LSGFTSLVLAGSRGGVEPVAAYAGVSHKGLVEVAGETLLARVLKALTSAGATRIAVSTDDEDLAARLPRGVERLVASESPSLSVRQGVEVLGTPILVTTVDHALLKGDWVRQFIDDTPRDADIAVLMAPEGVVREAAPGTRRTYLRLRDRRYSSCNLFLLRTPRALAAVDLWRRIEAHRKQPLRMALLIGPRMLLGYALGLLTLDAAVALIGRRCGVTAAAVLTPYGLAAVDVDKPADLDLVRRIAEG